MSMTVTATSPGGNGRLALAVRVLTGAAVVQPGRTASAVNDGMSLSISPLFTGSLIYGGAYSDASNNLANYAPFSGATTIFQDAAANNGVDEALAFRSTATTTAGTPVTLGVVARGTESLPTVALCEIKASGTLAEDASTPPVVPASGGNTLPSVASVTTAAFTPPAGALLVAITGLRNAAGSNATISDTSGLTWTPQIIAGTGNFFAVNCVWTALVPVPVIPAPPELLRQKGRERLRAVLRRVLPGARMQAVVPAPQPVPVSASLAIRWNTKRNFQPGLFVGVVPPGPVICMQNATRLMAEDGTIYMQGGQ